MLLIYLIFNGTACCPFIYSLQIILSQSQTFHLHNVNIQNMYKYFMILAFVILISQFVFLSCGKQQDSASKGVVLYHVDFTQLEFRLNV